MMRFLSNFSQLWHKHHKSFIFQTLGVALLCAISYFWIDRPLAIAMQQLNPNSPFETSNLADELTSIAYFIILLIMAFYAYMRISGKSQSRLIAAAGGISLAVPISFFIKTELQSILGRIPPRYGGSNTLLFVRKANLYGFHFFQSGSFPSGHMCVFTASLLMVCFYYPRFKPLAYLALFILAALLIFFNYHFLSDAIAGTYVGYIIAWAIHQIQIAEPMPAGDQRALRD